MAGAISKFHAKHPETSILLFTILFSSKEYVKNEGSPCSGHPKILSTEEEKDLLELANQVPYIKMRELQANIENYVSLDIICQLLHENNMRKW